MRILIIEDDYQTRQFLKRELSAQAYTVDTVECGERGSYTARTNEYDLIILDNILPKKNGKEICREIRGNGNTTPILILSAKSDPSHKTEMLNSGADDY